MTINLFGRDTAFRHPSHASAFGACVRHCLSTLGFLVEACRPGGDGEEEYCWRELPAAACPVLVSVDLSVASGLQRFRTTLCCARLGLRESADCPRRRAGALEAPALFRLRFFF